jgi:hypothetical protein
VGGDAVIVKVRIRRTTSNVKVGACSKVVDSMK